MKQGDDCPWCREVCGDTSILQLVGANEPWSEQHLACPLCHSTYNLTDSEFLLFGGTRIKIPDEHIENFKLAVANCQILVDGVWKHGTAIHSQL